MKNTVIKRCAFGAPIGVFISLVITIIISYSIGDGAFHAVTPELARDCGSEINAVTVQTLVSLLYGAVWAGASVIWEKENWSILKMTLVHLVLCSAATFPVGYLMRWMPHNVSGVLIYFGIFALIYAAIWLGNYSSLKKKLMQINDRLAK